jgi:peptidoglycan/LPS O-acetylase OafA/YrhL
MKKAIIVFIIAAMVLVTTGLWIYSTKESLKFFDLLSFGVIILVVGFALFVGYKRLTSAKRGEPSEDELSKKVLLRTAATSYYISLYLWVAMLFIKDRVNLDTDELLGAGILGMALSFAICWLIFHFKGIRNE